MDATILFFLLCFFCISGASIAEKQSPKVIKESKKLDYQEYQMQFLSPTANFKRGVITSGDVPIIHQTNAPASGGAWCIASPAASDTALQVALDYACGYGGSDCSQIQPSGACYDPSTVRDHASYAFNDYYRRNPAPTSCVFGGTAQITNTDPSRGNCRFASASSNPTTPTTIPITPPSTMTPIMPYAPVGGNGFDSEPTGTPSAAAAAKSLDTLLFAAVNFLVFSVALANCLLTNWASFF